MVRTKINRRRIQPFQYDHIHHTPSLNIHYFEQGPLARSRSSKSKPTSLHLLLLPRSTRRPTGTHTLSRRRRRSSLRTLQALPLPIPGAHITADAARAGVVTTAATLALSGQSALAVLAAVDNILQALAFARLGDLRPVEVLAGLGVVCDIGHGGGGDLALAAGGGAGVEVRGGVDFGVARGVDGLLDGLRGVVVLLLVVVLLVLGGGDCGWEGGDVGLEVG